MFGTSKHALSVIVKSIIPEKRDSSETVEYIIIKDISYQILSHSSVNSQFKGEYNDKIVDETSVSDKLRKCSVIGQELVKLGRDWLMFVISTIAFFECLPPGGSSDRVK